MPLRDWIPEPHVILLGCQPWPPRAEGPGCPACGGGVHQGDDSTFCAVCDSMSPRREAQVRAARLGLKNQDRLERGEAKVDAELRRVPVLSESERRRLWNGYHGGILAALSDDEITNRAKAGRDFLRDSGQEPDWSLVLNRAGRVVGRVAPE